MFFRYARQSVDRCRANANDHLRATVATRKYFTALTKTANTISRLRWEGKAGGYCSINQNATLSSDFPQESPPYRGRPCLPQHIAQSLLLGSVALGNCSLITSAILLRWPERRDRWRLPMRPQLRIAKRARPPWYHVYRGDTTKPFSGLNWAAP